MVIFNNSTNMHIWTSFPFQDPEISQVLFMAVISATPGPAARIAYRFGCNKGMLLSLLTLAFDLKSPPNNPLSTSTLSAHPVSRALPTWIPSLQYPNDWQKPSLLLLKQLTFKMLVLAAFFVYLTIIERPVGRLVVSRFAPNGMGGGFGSYTS